MDRSPPEEPSPEIGSSGTEPSGTEDHALPRADVPIGGGELWGDASPAVGEFRPPPPPAPARAASRAWSLAVGLAVGVGGGILAFHDRSKPVPVDDSAGTPLGSGESKDPRARSDAAPSPEARSKGGGSPPATTVAQVGAPTTVPTTAPSPFAPGDAGVLVVGADAASVAAAAQSRPAGAAPGRRFAAGSEADGRPGAALPAGVRALIAVGDDAVRVVRAAPAVPEEAPAEAWTTPAALAADVLSGLPLAVPAAARGAAVAAAGAVLSGDGPGALAALEGVPASPGVRVLRAWGALLAGDGGGVHAALEGLGRDPEVGPAARFLTGCALLEAGSAKEALRDFEAAVAERPAFWPASLMAGVANEALDLEDHADAAYAAVLAVVPDQPTARLRRAALLATPAPGAATTPEDRVTAQRRLEQLVADRPRFAAGWSALARVRARGDTSEDMRGTATAFERVASLRESDPRAWGDLFAARAAWAKRGGGADAYRSASEAAARRTTLAPEDGLAWYDRGALLHQWALDFGAGPPGAEGFRARLSEARLCYGKALGKGLEKAAAARAQCNLGFLLEVCPRCGAEQDGGDLPATAADAFQAALRLDPGNVGAILGLVATRITARDAAEAKRLLDTIPAGEVDPAERQTLLLAVAVIEKTPAAAAAGKDALPDLCRTLIAIGYRRVAITLLDGDTKDPVRLSLRCRARALIYDVDGLGADLALLAAADPAVAADLKSKDPVIRAALTR